MAFKHSSFFHPVVKDPEIVKREALIDAVIKDFLIPHDPRNPLDSKYLHAMYPERETILTASMDRFFGSAAEEIVNQALSTVAATGMKKS